MISVSIVRTWLSVTDGIRGSGIAPAVLGSKYLENLLGKLHGQGDTNVLSSKLKSRKTSAGVYTCERNRLWYFQPKVMLSRWEIRSSLPYLRSASSQTWRMQIHSIALFGYIECTKPIRFKLDSLHNMFLPKSSCTILRETTSIWVGSVHTRVIVSEYSVPRNIPAASWRRYCGSIGTAAWTLSPALDFVIMKTRFLGVRDENPLPRPGL